VRLRFAWWRIQLRFATYDRWLEVWFDVGSTWRWQRPLGWGPRWLRRTWCLLFHWRRFHAIGGSDCGVVWSLDRYGQPVLPLRPWFYLLLHQRSYGPEVRIYEHIENHGCGQCQFSWRRRYHYDTKAEGERIR